MLVNKFIIAFNLAYSLKPPSVTVTDVKDPQKPTEIIFVSLASRLALLYYRQLCDYLSGYNPRLRRADHREAIRELLKGKNYNSIYFKLFERHYWGEWPKFPLVEDLIQHSLEDISDIKYLLVLSEDERDGLQAIINDLRPCIWLDPPSIFKDKSEKLINHLQNYLDEYFVYCAEAGITSIISRTALQYRLLKKEAGNELVEQIKLTLANYQKEIVELGLLSDAEQEKYSLWKHIKLLLHRFLASIQNLLVPNPPCAFNFFRTPSSQLINVLTQQLSNACENTVLKIY